MKAEKPILFSGSMVKAILEGRKTQTRRVMRPQPKHNPKGNRGGYLFYDRWMDGECVSDGVVRHLDWTCPYGKVYSRLWVRETWAMHRFSAGRSGGLLPERITYKADGEVHGIKWRPSIFLRRKDSRITLEITGIRVERLQDISTADIQAEGILPDESYIGSANRYRHAWESGWNKINGNRPGCKWQDNPWVWVVEFKKLEATS